MDIHAIPLLKQRAQRLFPPQGAKQAAHMYFTIILS